MKMVHFTVVFLLFIAAMSHADLIKYTDKDGTLFFVDDLGKVPKKYRQNIIRDEDVSAAQTTTLEDQSRQTRSAGNGENEAVQICYGLSGFDSLNNGHIMTCFLNARDYPYDLLKVTDNPVNTKICAEYWCRQHKKDDSPGCVRETSQKIHWVMPFTVIGTRLFPTTKSHILKEIDRHFNVDPGSPVKWHELQTSHR